MGSWSAGGNLGTARRQHGACGTQTAGLCFGGKNSSNVAIKTCEEYSGTAWSAGGSLAAVKNYVAGCGTQTSGLSIGILHVNPESSE